jgi:hypothetical protein
MRDPGLALEQGELMPGYLLADESEQGRVGQAIDAYLRERA